MKELQLCSSLSSSVPPTCISTPLPFLSPFLYPLLLQLSLSPPFPLSFSSFSFPLSLLPHSFISVWLSLSLLSSFPSLPLTAAPPSYTLSPSPSFPPFSSSILPPSSLLPQTLRDSVSLHGHQHAVRDVGHEWQWNHGERRHHPG